LAISFLLINGVFLGFATGLSLLYGVDGPDSRVVHTFLDDAFLFSFFGFLAFFYFYEIY